jgi:O-antigen biosynthesis protein
MTSIFRFWLNLLSSKRQRFITRRNALKGLEGSPEGRALLKFLGQAPEAFDADTYVSMLTVPMPKHMSALRHFLEFGYKSGKVGQFFNSRQYEAHYRDISSKGLDGLFHFNSYGKAEGRTGFYVEVKQKIVSKSQINYENWLVRNRDQLDISPQLARQAIDAFAACPTISIIMPVYNAPLLFLKKAVASVQAQYYANWELCIADDASTNEAIKAYLGTLAASDPRIKVTFRKENGHISRASNSALELATGAFVGLLDQDDELTPDALFWIVDAVNKQPDADIIYSDEDKTDESGQRFDPYFKSDFNYELLLAQNMISHFGVYRRDLIEKIGGFRVGFEGSQDHDLVLRAIEQSEPHKILHVPRILYHWRALEGSTAQDLNAKSYATETGRLAVAEHLARLGVRASVTVPDPLTGHYRVTYELFDPLPLISIIIPTRDRVDLLKTCVNSIFDKTTYKNYEIIVVDNDSADAETISYFEAVKSRGVRIIHHGGAFNFATINNAAVRDARGQILVFLNNDIEVISQDWLEEMLSFAQRPQIGCVGARLWYPNDSLQHGGVFLGMGGVAGHGHKHLPKGERGYFNRAVSHQALSAVTAACLMVRRDVFDRVGGFDEELAVAFNDVDLCLRIRGAGFRNVYTPFAELYHHESVSRGDDTSPEKAQRFNSEVEFMHARWGKALREDPFYNPNLSLDHDDFSIAYSPRLSTVIDEIDH